VAWRQQRGEHNDEEREGGENEENPRPADAGRDKTADGRREQRRDAEHQDQERDDFCALFDRKVIANHRGRADLRGAAAERLQQAHADKEFRRARGEAAERSKDEKDKPGIDRKLAAETVEEGAIEQLSRGKPDKIAGDRE
jgi:hypothetical protein